MDDKVVWVLAPADNGWIQCLTASGCRVVVFSDAAALRGMFLRPGTLAPDALVLLADVAVNCRAAHAVRSVWPGLILLAWYGQPVGPEQAALLSSGVDYVLRPEDPPALLVSVLLALDYRRARFGPDVQPRPFVPVHQAAADLCIGSWRLMDQGWVLGYGHATALHLTVSERAVLLCLFEAPGHVASHADLIAAVLQVWQPRQQARIRDPRCRSIISRLRQRACDAGMPMPPIESLRDFGYAWAL
ncbi:hypothetical protein [Castellaniella sp.]|uniref:helix-turn-helix domain-containing protein n=1 Tax=Castellaniella sp. TaxID=1955812 RepID=UPI002B00033E|nr:hypothetical protein [Castellaniella sp.]